MDPVYDPMDLFHGFSYRKIIQVILKITGALDLKKTP
jgi:hypothetical protein